MAAATHPSPPPAVPEALLGYRVETTGSERVPYRLHGERGALYGLVRSFSQPALLFAINLRKYGVVGRLGRFTDANGPLRQVRS